MIVDFRERNFDPQNKLVTVAVASYNNAPYVISTLVSIYNQTYAPIELKIVDDSSTDNSVNLINEWITKNNLQVSLTVNKQNKGVCFVCNKLIKQVGYYFVLIGSDDEMEMDRLEKQIAYFKTLSEEYGLVYSDMSTMDKNSKLVEPSWFKQKGVVPIEGGLFEPFLREQFRFPSPSIIYRAEVFEVVGEYDEQLKTEDIDMILRILRHFKVGFCPIVSVRYRVVAKPLSRQIGGRFYKDRIAIYRKFLGVSKVLDGYIESRIITWAQSAYFSGYAESKSLLLQAVKTRFTFKIFLLLLFAWSGLRGQRISKFINFAKK